MCKNIGFAIDDNSVDDHVDEEIKECLRAKKSFFMFAGAGSGKTKSLVNALNYIADEFGENLYLKQKQVAVITYTNAACDEIMRRVGYNSLFAVSTIHSFLWELIKPYQKDIKIWMKNKLETDIKELQQKQAEARSRDYSGDIAKKQIRLDALKTIYKFSYDPNGENVGRESLDHSEVIKMGSLFIQDFETMQKVIISKYPIVFIDESQDTKKELVDAILTINPDANDFVVGMFGDTMQRIYLDGKENLATVVPDAWERPAKVMNHRSAKRIIQLANAIQSTIDSDKKPQQPRKDKSNGFVRLFLASSSSNRADVENTIFAKMSEISKDKKWLDINERKTLVLEHSMAAKRLGFETLDENLKVFDQSFRDGTLVELAFLMKVIYPFVTAKQAGNSFAAMKILRKHSPLMKKQAFKSSDVQLELLQNINKQTDLLVDLWSSNNTPSCIDIYKTLNALKLFDLPKQIDEVLNEEVDVSDRIAALRKGLGASFSELNKYWEYTNNQTQFATHQGIKGLEFDRVAVVMDDESAGGTLFSYEKLFGAKSLSDTDKKNKAENKDNAITRTMRLFYVACTRAKESLALIAYTNDINAVEKTAKENCWFTQDEIIIINENESRN